MKYIDTPYGRKTPELLCKAMDALALQPELIQVIEDYLLLDDLHDRVGAVNDAAKQALAKAKGE
jgi:hypothetical protein